METIRKVLSELEKIVSATQEAVESNKPKINIFRVLDIESSEVTLHSRFLAYLFNPNEDHCLGSFFLEKLVRIIGIEVFNKQNVEVFIEYDLGPVSIKHETGGRLDILIRDGSRKLAIENKVYAGLRKKQLECYQSFMEKDPIVFLTLFKDSVFESDKFNNCINITYHDHVRNWLAEAIEKIDSGLLNNSAIDLLCQYQNTLNNLTGGIMNEKICSFIKENPMYGDSLDVVVAELHEVKKRVSRDFYKKISKKEFLEEEFIQLENAHIHCYYNETNEGLWMGFKFINSNNEEINNHIENPEAKKIFEHIMKKFPDKLNNSNHSNWNFMWYTPVHITYKKRIVDESINKVLKYESDPNLMESHINAIEQEARVIRDEVKKEFGVKIKD